MGERVDRDFGMDVYTLLYLQMDDQQGLTV